MLAISFIFAILNFRGKKQSPVIFIHFTTGSSAIVTDAQLSLMSCIWKRAKRLLVEIKPLFTLCEHRLERVCAEGGGGYTCNRFGYNQLL